MFRFEHPEDGSADRHQARVQATPKLVRSWWLVHNLVAHPLIGILPFKPFFAFHDWTSHRMHGRKR